MNSSEQEGDEGDWYRDFSYRCAVSMVVLCIIGLAGNSLSLFVFSRRSMRRASINVLLSGLSATDLLLLLIVVPTFALPPLAGLAGNSLSLFVFSRRSMRRASINVLLSGLSATNLLLLLIVVPTFALPPLAGETLASSNMLLDFTHYMIVYAYPFCLTLQTASVWIFCLITVERYLAVCRPLLVGQLCSPARSRLALAAVYLAASAYNAVRFWEYRTADCGDPGLCGTVVTEPLLRADVGYWLWYGTVLYLLTQFLLPFLLMLTLNTAVVYRMYKCRKTVARKSSHFGRRTARKQISGDKTPVINLFRLRTSSMNYEHRTALMMLIIVFVFVTCYALSFLLNFAEAVDPELFYRPDTSALAYLLNDLSNALVVLNSASTWLVYLAMSGRYRRLALGALFACLPRRLRPPSSPDPFSSLAPSTIGMRKSPYRKSRSSAGLLLSLNDTDRNGEKAQLHRPLLSRNSVSGPFDLHRARQL